MSVRAKFHYGHTVDELNYYIDFDEGGGELSAELNIGDYTLTEYAAEVSRALTATGGQTYTVSVDRDTRVFTISAPSTFSLLVSTGSHSGTSAYSLMGFSGADKTGALTYDGSVGSGSEYIPQFFLQGYISSNNLTKAVSSKVNKSGSGDVEAFSFGNESFMECNITYATDIEQTGEVILNNPTGVSDLRSFMTNLIGKTRIEFMEDKENTSSYEKMILEKTRDSKDGTGFRLKPLYARGLPQHYETGQLTFRVVF